MTITQLIYRSQPFGFDDAMLNGILVQARRNNPRHDITGALIVRSDVYLQLLEGPDTAISALFGQIIRDDRHLAITPISRETVGARLFAGWSMRDDPAESWFWSEAEIANNAFERAGLAGVRAVFEQLAAKDPSRSGASSGK